MHLATKRKKVTLIRFMEASDVVKAMAQAQKPIVFVCLVVLPDHEHLLKCRKHNTMVGLRKALPLN
jgi:hypothetical protein